MAATVGRDQSARPTGTTEQHQALSKRYCNNGYRNNE